MPNDEGITPLHNAVCAGHHHIVKFLLDFGVNVNAADSDGWSVILSRFSSDSHLQLQCRQFGCSIIFTFMSIRPC